MTGIPYQCSPCGRDFRLKAHLRSHTSRLHGHETGSICSIDLTSLPDGDSEIQLPQLPSSPPQWIHDHNAQRHTASVLRGV